MMRKKWIEEGYVQQNYKTKPCRTLNCKKDFTCPFYHGWADRRREGENYCTKGCRHAFEDNTWSDPTYNCQDGDECLYAHSRIEMQFHSRKYKTQTCREYVKGKDKCTRAFFCAFKHGREYPQSPQPDGKAPMTTFMPVPSTSRAAGPHAVFGSQSYARIASLGLNSPNETQALVPDRSPQMGTEETDDIYGDGACGPLLPERDHQNGRGNGFTHSDESPSPDISFPDDGVDDEVFGNLTLNSSWADDGEVPSTSFSSLRISTGRGGDDAFLPGNHEVPGCSRQLTETRLENLQRKVDMEDIRGRQASLRDSQNPQSGLLDRSLFGPYSHALDDGVNGDPGPSSPPVPTPPKERKSSMLPLWMGLTGSELETWATDDSELVDQWNTMETDNVTEREPWGVPDGGEDRGPILSSGHGSKSGQMQEDQLYRTGVWVDAIGNYEHPKENGDRNSSNHNGHYNGAGA